MRSRASTNETAGPELLKGPRQRVEVHGNKIYPEDSFTGEKVVGDGKEVKEKQGVGV